jgi:hypothetical protein
MEPRSILSSNDAAQCGFGTSLCATYNFVNGWWKSVIYTNGTSRKIWRLFIVLTTWKIWNKRNVRIFRNKYVYHALTIMDKIKVEAALWSVACVFGFNNIAKMTD